MLKTSKSNEPERLTPPAADDRGDWIDVREVGTSTAVREFIGKLQGLPSCINGQQV